MMKKMDVNGDGIIEWKEFLDALAGWLKEESRGEDKKTAATASTGAGASASNKARAHIHKRISSFFTQYKRATNFTEIRAKMAAEVKKGNTTPHHITSHCIV